MVILPRVSDFQRVDRMQGVWKLTGHSYWMDAHGDHEFALDKSSNALSQRSWRQ